MDPLTNVSGTALRQLLETQPTSPAKIAFAWRMAAGPAVHRATETDWRGDGVLIVRAHADAWRREVRQARPLLLRRMQDLLGAGVVTRIKIE